MQRFGQKPQRLCGAAALQVEKTEQLQRVEIVGPVIQNCHTQSFGLLQMALLKRTVSVAIKARQVGRSRGGIVPMSRQVAFPRGMAGLKTAFESGVAPKATMFGVIQIDTRVFHPS